MPAPRPPAHGAIFGGEGPRWFTIAAHRPFLVDLAFALDAALSPLGPEALAEAVVLTPTRRAARELAEAFVRTAAGPAVLLPRIRALGDLDEGEPPFEPGELVLNLAPAISVTRRRFELARLVVAHAHLFERPIDTTAALELGDALARFLDSIQIEETADPERIEALVEGELALHWRRSADFLRIATVAWPQRLADLGLMDVTERRTALLRALAGQWAAAPPPSPLVAAGSTGTAPATAELLGVIAGAPQGCVVLPGLDLGLADTAWAQVADAHPQGALRRLLTRFGRTREQVRPWPAPESLAQAMRGRARQRVVNEALRPAEATADWIKVIAALRAQAASAGADPIADGLDGLSVAAARTEDQAAAMIALLMRETLEHPTRTAALVTPDVALARRVSARLARWGLQVDSSAGAPLAQFPAGALMATTARAALEPMAPANLLAILKHPRVRLGLEHLDLEAGRRTLERYGLRGSRARGWDQLHARLDSARMARKRADGDGKGRDGVPWDQAHAVLAALQRALSSSFAGFRAGAAPAVDAARALAEALEALCADPHGHVGGLWSGPDGEGAAELLASLMDEGQALPDCTAAGFAELIEAMLAAHVVRAGGASHPRLRILGVIEARLVDADRLILAGLEEGVWPGAAENDPFLSRPMRARLGLPPPERRTGLSAHDFAQAACAPEVVLVHSERRAGQPAVMSRWLWRLETLARGADVALPRRDELAAWAHSLDAALSPAPKALAAASRPAPRPPVDARPTELPVTGVETWVRDPYAVYARHVLELRALDRPDERIEARARGTAIHKAFERFAQGWDQAQGGERFAQLYIEALQAQGVPDAALAREAVLAERAGGWVAEVERQRRGACREVLVEQHGRIGLTAPDGSGFTLTCRADRLEVSEHGVHVVDFKTGRAPSRPEVDSDFAPQLTLTAAIIMNGGFEVLGARAPGDLVYLRVTGRTPPGEVIVRGRSGESAAMAADALQGLQGLVARYRNPGQPYRSRIAPRFVADHFSDYDHLARVREWSAADEEDEV